MKMALPVVALGKLVDIVMGQAPSSKDCNFDGCGTPFVKVGEFGDLRPVIREWTTNPLKMALPTDVLLCVVGATCGKINLGEECAIGRSVAAIRPDKEKLDQFYLYYFMMTLVERLRDGSVGAAQTVISKGMIETVRLPDVPLPEQQRVVRILDKAFASITTARANAEKNLQNARALFESHLKSVFSQRGGGWAEKALGDIAKVKGGKRVPKGYKLLVEPTEFPYLRVADFTDTGTIETNDLRYISSEIHQEIKNYVIYSKDLYISIAGTIGKTGIVPEELDGAHLTENACRLVFNPGISNQFVYYFTLTPDFAEQAGLHTRTAAQPKLALARLSTIKLWLPHITVQKRLANEFDSIRQETQRLKSIYQQKLTALDELKKSLLHQAFSGQL